MLRFVAVSYKRYQDNKHPLLPDDDICSREKAGIVFLTDNYIKGRGRATTSLILDPITKILLLV
jgi:hypothetical protein